MPIISSWSGAGGAVIEIFATLHGCRIQPALGRPDAGVVGHPLLVRAVSLEVPLQRVPVRAVLILAVALQAFYSEAPYSDFK